jgi:hypothetical protein
MREYARGPILYTQKCAYKAIYLKLRGNRDNKLVDSDRSNIMEC